MIFLPKDCIVLEGATCLGHLSVTPNRLFCPRSIYAFWREIWLERVDPPGPPRAASSFGEDT